MARKKSHRDVRFHVSAAGETDMEIYQTFDEAAGMAVVQAMSEGKKVHIDIVVWSKAGARWLYGDDGVEQYEEDPEASVFERIEVKANILGRIA